MSRHWTLPSCVLSYLLIWFSVAKSCLNLCCPMDCSTPGFPVLHYLSQFIQTQVHWVSDAIQPSHPLSPPSPPALNLSEHQSPFQWVSSLQQVSKVIRASASTYISQMEKPTLTETKLIFQIPKANVTTLFWPHKFISRVNALRRQSQPLFLNFIHPMPQMRRGSYSNDCWSEVDACFGYQSLGM